MAGADNIMENYFFQCFFAKQCLWEQEVNELVDPTGCVGGLSVSSLVLKKHLIKWNIRIGTGNLADMQYNLNDKI